MYYTLAEFGIQPFATIDMMVLTCSAPEKFDRVVFDLSWNYPMSGRDFLDASCLLYMNDESFTFVDSRTPRSKDEIWYSGTEMNDTTRIGCHRIEAKLESIPKCVSHLFFLPQFIQIPIHQQISKANPAVPCGF